MLITNQEKQVLQKHYAEKVKSRARTLNDLIQGDRQDVLATHLTNIHDDVQRISQIQNEWRNDTSTGVRHDTVIFNEAEKLKQSEAENGYEK